MRRIETLKDAGRLIFTFDEVRQIFNTSAENARLYLTRAVKRGDIYRIKRGLYALPSFTKEFREEDYFRLANFIQTPSYISLTSALSYYNLTTQLSSQTLESVSQTRSVQYNLKDIRFSYFRTSKKYYFGFKPTSSFFIATPEKAIIDAAHLAAFGKYAIDVTTIDFEKFDYALIDNFLKKYPDRTVKLLNAWRQNYENYKTT